MHRKEEAFALVSIAAQKNGYQILDDAIGLAKIRVQHANRKLIFVSTYEFQYADDKQQRHVGKIIRQGQQWCEVEFHGPTFIIATQNENKVIAFPGHYKHD
jgi:hypothetical protein